jgi:hypothetical protein
LNAALLGDLKLIGLSVLGAFVLYVLNRNNGREPFSLFKVLNLDVSVATGLGWLILLDMVVSSALGGSVVYLIVTPTTAAQAVVSGLGMTGLLSAQVRSS